MAYFALFCGMFLFGSNLCELTYPLIYCPEAVLEIDGKATEPAWRKTFLETSFSLPWEPRQASKTAFRALLTEDALLFFFAAQDLEIVDFDGREETEVTRGDRVEVFFSLDEGLTRYYCLEISPSGKVLDYEASYYRDFSRGWSLEGLQVASQRSKRAYNVEAAIPLASLQQLGFPWPGAGDWIRVGLFRADFRHRAGKIEEHWISWCRPRVASADFHVPTAFGKFRVVQSVSPAAEVAHHEP